MTPSQLHESSGFGHWPMSEPVRSRSIKSCEQVVSWRHSTLRVVDQWLGPSCLAENL
jgi:hypothetical protein